MYSNLYETHYKSSCVGCQGGISHGWSDLQHLLAMALYMLAVIVIGIVFARRANKDAEAYFLGGRSLGPWVTAFSAEASTCPAIC